MVYELIWTKATIVGRYRLVVRSARCGRADGCSNHPSVNFLFSLVRLPNISFSRVHSTPRFGVIFNENKVYVHNININIDFTSQNYSGYNLKETLHRCPDNDVSPFSLVASESGREDESYSERDIDVISSSVN